MSDYIYEDDEDASGGWIADPFSGGGLEVPFGDVTDIPLRCVQVSDEWVGFIVGALERLKSGDMWVGTDADRERAYRNIDTLQALLAVGECPEAGEAAACVDVKLTNPLITWLPSDPFRNPEYIPPGYAAPIWIINTNDIPIGAPELGAVEPDPINFLLAFPPIIPLSGVPRCQIHFSGQGSVDLGFHAELQGGLALILLDGSLHSWIDLQNYAVLDFLSLETLLDLFGVALELLNPAVQQVEIAVENPGNHIIEIQWIVRPGGTAILGFGGWLESVQFCGVTEPSELENVIEDVRINGGTIQKRVVGEWLNVAVPDGADVLVETDLRGQGCELQFYDLATATWTKIAATDYLNVLDTCDIIDTLTIDSPSNLALQFRDNLNGLHQFFAASGQLRILPPVTGTFLVNAGSPQSRFLMNTDGRFYIGDQTSSGLNGEVNIYTTQNRVPLKVQARNVSIAAIQHWIDNADRVLAEIAYTGWFSAIQQLIVNDFSSTAVKRGQGRILGQWEDATDATRKGRMIVQADDFAAAREGLRVEASGTAVKLGFFGSAAAYKQTVDDPSVDNALAQLLEALDQYGLIENQTNLYGSLPAMIPTYSEVKWDIRDFYPTTQDLPLTIGTWVENSGFVAVTSGTVKKVVFGRYLFGNQDVFRWLIQFQVANLTAGVVTLRVEDIAETPFVLFHEAAFTDGIYQEEIVINRRTDNSPITITLTTDTLETADIAVEIFWELAEGTPRYDDARVVSEYKVVTDIPQEFTL